VRRRHYLKDGNDDAIRRTARTDVTFSEEVPGGQKSHQPYYSTSLLALGRYWGNRILTTVGARRDNFRVYRPSLHTDSVTGLAYYQHNPDGTEYAPRALNLWVTRLNYGAVFSPVNQFRAFWNYAENFQQDGVNPYFNGDPREPRSGVGIDYGVSLYLFKDRFTATVTRFDNKAQNQGVSVLANQNIVDEINRLLGTSYNTGYPQDTRSRQTKGWEFELVANPTPQWALSFKWSERRLANTDFVPRFTRLLEQMKAATTDSTRYALTQAQYDTVTIENADNGMNWNVTTRYSFTRGPLKGARVGTYGFMKQTRTFNIANRPALTVEGYVMVNAFVSYDYKYFGQRRGSLQLNIENLRDLQTRIGNNYTGYSYLAPRRFVLTQRFDF
jgi:outer membrane receptor for ferric coprogen and ferric-rhodotorulic acid